MPLLLPVTSVVVPTRLHRSSRLFAPGTISYPIWIVLHYRSKMYL
jgi:hypothetical protein